MCLAAHGLKRRASPSSEIPRPVSRTAMRSSCVAGSKSARRAIRPRPGRSDAAERLAATLGGVGTTTPAPRPLRVGRGGVAAAAVNLMALPTTLDTTWRARPASRKAERGMSSAMWIAKSIADTILA